MTGYASVIDNTTTHTTIKGLKENGFTLLEVLVALAIVAIALTALTGSANTVNHNSVAIQERTIALWVAEDIMNEHRITHQWPSIGRHEGTRTMSGNDWKWKLLIETTNTQDMFRATVTVANESEPDRTLTSLNTYYSTYLRSIRAFDAPK